MARPSYMELWKPAPDTLTRLGVGGPAILNGRNKYSGIPVNSRGLTFTADYARRFLLKQFPNSPTKFNYAVDRNARGTTRRSEHAEGISLDWMVPGYDGDKSDISDEDIAFGRSVMAYAIDVSKGYKLEYSNGRAYRGPLRLRYLLFNGYIWYATKDSYPDATDPLSDGWMDSTSEWREWAELNEVRRLKPTSDQHRNHVHMSFTPDPDPSNWIDEDFWTSPAVEPPSSVGTPATVQFPNIAMGSEGTWVKFVQTEIQRWMRPIAVDGEFGPITERAVKDCQAIAGEYIDGLVGPKTWEVFKHLNATSR